MITALIVLTVLALLCIGIVIKASEFRRCHGYGRIFKQAYNMPKRD